MNWRHEKKKGMKEKKRTIGENGGDKRKRNGPAGKEEKDKRKGLHKGKEKVIKLFFLKKKRKKKLRSKTRKVTKEQKKQ